MPPRATGSATISFGLVSVQCKLYTATEEPQARIIDLMDALGASLRRRDAGEEKPRRSASRKSSSRKKAGGGVGLIRPVHPARA